MVDRNRVIAVDEGLTPVCDELKSRGYQVVDVSHSKEAHAIVMSGGHQNFMGIHDTITKAPIITAWGRDASEVADEVEKRISR